MRSTKAEIVAVNLRLCRLSALKDQINLNFPGSTEDERYAVLGIIAQVCDREENLKRHLIQEQLAEL